MGRHKKGYNSEARKVVKGKFVDQQEVKQLQTKVMTSDEVNQDAPEQTENDTNPLVLPAKKRKFKKDKDPDKTGRILSRKKRKLLEKVVEQKRKKAERGELIEKLKEVQLDGAIMDKMTSISQVQTKGIKRQMQEDKWMEQVKEENQDGVDIEQIQLETVKANPVKRRKLQKLLPKKEVKSGPNVIGFDESSSEEEEEEEEDKDLNAEEQDNEESSEESDDNEQQPKEEEVKITPKVEVKESEVNVDKPPSPAIPQGHILVKRTPEIQAVREQLPILGEEHAVMEAINHNQVVILAGETGSGKTTQVPQFLYEAGYTKNGQMIAVTEPRRVAAMSMSKRVGVEMGLPQLVSYQVRFEGNSTEETKIKFMTDGVLLREMSKDFSLKKYSVIVIDEAHERSVFTDILIGSLSRVVRQRSRRPDLGGPLRLVIMSATLRVEDFYRMGLFRATEEQPKPPCIKVEGRQFQVAKHNLKKTPEDYLAAALKKTCQIHKELPEGGILVFVTGQQEVNYMVRKLRKLFPYKSKKAMKQDEEEKEESVEAAMKTAIKTMKKKSLRKRSESLSSNDVNLDNYRVVPLDDVEADALRTAEEDEELELGGDEVDQKLMAELGRDAIAGCQPLWCLPLYSLLSTERQNRIFEPPPKGHRLCVVATNIAETSLTIPGIKYVVDTGKVKEKFYDKLTGVSTFQVTWTSKASADQRLGRAGRLGDGHCYRLYSTQVFEDSFPKFSRPDILRRPVEDLVLQMKSMGLIKVKNFPFPTPPDPEQLLAAEQRLMALGALKRREVAEPESDLKSKKTTKKSAKQYELVATDLGRSVNAFPVAPCFGKMLALSEQRGLMPHTVLMVSALTVQEALLEVDVGDHKADFDAEHVANVRRIWAGKGGSNSFLLGDPMLLIKAVCASEREAERFSLKEFCAKYALRHKAMVEIKKLRRQLTNEVNLLLPRLKLELQHLEPPNDETCLLLRQIILSGMVNQVARKVVPVAGQGTPKELALAYECDDIEDPVYLHGKSLFAVRSKREKLPEWVVYQERFEVEGKCYLRGVTAIDPDWLPDLCTSKCTFVPPSGKTAEPWFDSDSGQMKRRMHVTFGRPRSFPLQDRDVPYPSERAGDDLDDPIFSAHFARFLLDPKSEVLPKLVPLLDKILCIPSTFVTMSSHNQRREVAAFLKKLAEKNVFSRKTLEQALEEDGDFLKVEFKGLVPKARHRDVDGVWPPL